MTKRAVQEAIQDGRLDLVNGKLDLEAIEAAWAERSEPARVRGGKQNGNSHAQTFVQVRTAQKQLEIEIAKTRLDVERGDLVSITEVEATRFNDHRAARDRLMTIRRLAPELAAESDPKRCLALLEAELELICKALAEGGS